MAKVEIPEVVYVSKSGTSKAGNPYAFVIQKGIFVTLGRRVAEIELQHDNISGLYPIGEYTLDLESLITEEKGRLVIDPNRLRDARLQSASSPVAAVPQPLTARAGTSMPEGKSASA